MNKVIAAGIFERHLHRMILRNPQFHALLDPEEHLFQIHIRFGKLERSGLDLRQVQNVIDQLKQQLVVIFDDRNILPSLFIAFRIGQHARKSDNGIQRRTDFMAHVGQKRRFQPV